MGFTFQCQGETNSVRWTEIKEKVRLYISKNSGEKNTFLPFEELITKEVDVYYDIVP